MFTMFGAAFWLFVGLMIGWFVLPQPQWAVDLWNWIAFWKKDETDPGTDPEA